jgi:arabinofuranan 3-O-arabinosyltransferase
MMVLAIALAFLIQIGLHRGFRRYELPALGLVAALLLFYPLVGAPTGFGATLIVSGLIAGRCRFRRSIGASASSASPNIGPAAHYGPK